MAVITRCRIVFSPLFVVSDFYDTYVDICITRLCLMFSGRSSSDKYLLLAKEEESACAVQGLFSGLFREYWVSGYTRSRQFVSE